MRRKLLLVAAPLILALVALRIYGAYQRERDDALERAAVHEQKARQLDEQSARLRSQGDCNVLWMQYENAKTKKEIAEMEGRLAAEPARPSCSGHAGFGGATQDLLFSGLKASLAALNETNMAQYEREYAASTNYRSRYLLLRMWSSVIGTRPRVSQAEMVARVHRAADLENCVKKAADDSDRKKCKSSLGGALD